MKHVTRMLCTMSKKTKANKTANLNANDLDTHTNNVAVHADKAGNMCIRVLTKPGAKQNIITEVGTESVAIQIAAPPIEGEANTELIKYLSKVLQLRKSDLQIDKGMRSRVKVVLVNKGATTADTILELLLKEIAR